MFNIRTIGSVLLASMLFVSTGFADVKKKDERYATRTIDEGTKVQLIIGDTIVPAIFNQSSTSKALLDKLPYSVRLQKYTHGFCGSISDQLPIEPDQLHDGWLDGDIVYSKDSNELAILYKDEQDSKNLYQNLVTVGTVTSPLSTIENLDRSIQIKITLD